MKFADTLNTFTIGEIVKHRDRHYTIVSFWQSKYHTGSNTIDWLQCKRVEDGIEFSVDLYPNEAEKVEFPQSISEKGQPE